MILTQLFILQTSVVTIKKTLINKLTPPITNTTKYLLYIFLFYSEGSYTHYENYMLKS